MRGGRKPSRQRHADRGATIWSEQELNSLRNDLLVHPAVQLYIVERISR